MSSTGFGSQVKFSQQLDETPLMSYQSARQIPPQSKFTSVSSRPPPRFNDNWKDLFPDISLTSDGQVSEVQSRPYVTPQFNAPYVAQRPSFSPSDTSSLSTSTGSSYQQQPTLNHGSDFIPQASAQRLNNNSNDLLDHDNMYDFDFLMNNDVSTFTGESGLNLGFDADHDWADGGSARLPDLFGGFFFGGPPSEDVDMHTTTGFPVTGGYDALAASGTGMWD